MYQILLLVAANAVLLLHLTYVSFVVVGLLAIVIGLMMRKSWARSPGLRIAHLTAIGIVVGETLLGITCPLTILERRLREAAGQPAVEGDFIASWVHRLMFFDLPPWLFATMYVAFGLTVLAIFLIAPPRWPRAPESAPAK